MHGKHALWVGLTAVGLGLLLTMLPNDASGHRQSTRRLSAATPAARAAGGFTDHDLALINATARMNNEQVALQRVALRRSRTADIRHLAQRLLTYHGRLNRDLHVCVVHHAWALPHGMNQPQRETVSITMGGPQDAFDRDYLRVQMQEQGRLLHGMRRGATHGHNEALRRWARSQVAIVEEHLQWVRALYNPGGMS